MKILFRPLGNARVTEVCQNENLTSVPCTSTTKPLLRIEMDRAFEKRSVEGAVPEALFCWLFAAAAISQK
jgi:hypothetical protein